MSQMIRWLGILVATASGVFATPAAAVQWNNDSATATACGSPASNAAGCEQFSINVGGQILKVRAYSTATVQGNATNPTGNWITAELDNFSSGFGVDNRVGGDGGEGNDPEHATDNNQVVDILVFELPKDQIWDLDAFRLGWAREDGSTQADVQAWFGGTGLVDNYNFANVCFTGCATPLATGAGNLGFTSLGTFENVQQGASVSVAGTQAGRYLVMAGQLGEQNDAFKLEMLKATGTTPPGGQTPVPGTLALLGLGLVGLRSMRLRAARA